MVCEVRVNAIKYLQKKEATDDVRKIIDTVKFDELNQSLTELAVDKYGLETNGQLLFDKTSKKILDERNSTYYRDTTFKVERAEPNVALFDQLQILKAKYDNAKAIAKQSIVPVTTDTQITKNESLVDIIKPGVNSVFEAKPALKKAVFDKLGYMTVYQGYNQLDDREFNYFTIDQNEAKDYGTSVREVVINPRSLLKGDSVEYNKLVNDYYTKTGQRFDILNNTPKGLKNQNDFFEFLKTKGYYGLDFTMFSDTRYVVSFGDISISPQDEQRAFAFYSEYLNTVFPNSMSKDILFHGSDSTFDVFDLSKRGSATGAYNFEDPEQTPVDSLNAFFFSTDTAVSQQYSILRRIEQIENITAALSNTLFDWSKGKEIRKYSPELSDHLKEKQKELSTEQLKEYIRELYSKYNKVNKDLGTGFLNLYNNYTRLGIQLEYLKSKKKTILSGKYEHNSFSSTHPNLGISLYNGVNTPGEMSVYIYDDGEIRSGEYNGRNISSLSSEEFDKLISIGEKGYQKGMEGIKATLKKAKITPVLYRVILDIQKPLVKDFEKQTFVDQVDKKGAQFEASKLANQAAKSKGEYDSVVYKNILDPYLSDNYGVFEPEQIHILGSDKDIQMFEDFAESNTPMYYREAPELSDKLQSFLNDLNFTVEFKDDMLHEFDPKSLTDLLYKTILVKNNYKDPGLLKETAYVAYSFLGKKNKIRTDLIHSIENLPNYNEIYEKYVTKNTNLSNYKIKELIIVDFIADAIKNNFEVPKDSYINRKADYWGIKGNSKIEKKIKYYLSKIKRFILDLFGGTKLSQEQVSELLDDIANDVINQNYDKFGTKLSPEQQLTNYEETILKDPKAEGIIKEFQKLGLVLTGSLALRKTGTIYREIEENLHDLDFSLTIGDHGKFFNDLIEEYKKLQEGASQAGKNLVAEAFTRELAKNYTKHPIFNAVKKLYPNFMIKKAFSSNDGIVTVLADIDGYAIDFFFRPEPILDKNEQSFQDWEYIFMAKLKMGRVKDIRDFANYKLYNRKTDGSFAEIPGFRHFTFPDTNSRTVLSTKKEKLNDNVPVVDINLDVINNAISKEVGEVLAKKLSAKMGVDFETVTPEEAQNLLANSSKPYMGEPAFYFAGTIYFVGNNVNARTVLHEFSHPMIQGIRRNDPVLFEKLFAELESTDEGQAIINHVKKLYPELGANTPLFKEEALVFALQLDAINKINNQIESEGYQSFINKLLAALKQFLRGVFGTAVNIKNLKSTTTISELGDMLLSDEELELGQGVSEITEQDLVMFYKDVVERADELLKHASPEAAQAIINQTYLNNKAAVNQAREFNTGKDAVNKAMLQRALLKEGTTELLPAVDKSLRGFQDIIPSNNINAESVIENSLNAEEKIQEMARIKAVALVNSMDRIKSSSINTLNELRIIEQNDSLINNRNVVALLQLYKSTANSWMNLVDEINNILEDSTIDTDNPFYQTVNEILNNSKMVVKKVSDIYKKNNVQFFVEITGYMTKFVEEQLNTNLKTALKNLPADEQEAEVDNLYNKVVDGTIQDEDLVRLYEKGVPKEVLNRFIEQYNTYVINEKRINDILSGKTKDVSWFNRWLESYSSSNDPIVGSLAMYIQNEKTEVENEVWDKSQIFRNKLSKILPQVNFSKLNSLQIRDMVAGKDTIFYIDKKTGQPVPKEVWTFLNEFGNGWRYEKDKLEYEYAEAKDGGDKNKIAEALDRVRKFNKAYMWQEYVPEFYEKDDIFNTSDIGKLAYLAKKNAFDNFINLQNQFEKELERFENYSTIEAAFRTYQQLYSLYYEDGTEKVDDPATGNYDRSIAELLIQHRNSTSDFYEWVPITNSLDTAYNEFVTELEAKNIKRGTPEFETELRKWEKQNIKIKYSDEFYEDRAALLNRLTEIQGRMRETMNLTFDISGAYKTISDLIFTYRDEFGQPDTTQLGVERIRKIKELEQDIINFREKFDYQTGLSVEDANALNFLLQKSKTEALDSTEAKTLNNLIQKQKDNGIDVALVEEMTEIFSSLSDLSSKVPTEYYLEAINTYLSKYNVAEVSDITVDNFVNSEEFEELLLKDDELRKWFVLNHVTVKKYEKGKQVEKLQRTSANSVLRPNDGKYFVTTKIFDNEAQVEVTLLGVPNARHSRREVKNKYRTIPRGANREDYIGKYINNKGEFLPRSFEPGTKYSAEDDRFIDKRYQALKANPNSPEFELLNLMKDHHLEMQKNAGNYGKLYLDVPRYTTKKGDFYQVFQKGQYGEKFNNINSNVKEWLKQKFGKSTEDYLNDLNYDSDNNLVNTDLNGDEISYIPVTGIFNIDADLADADVFNSLFRYGLSLQTQKQLHKSLPLVQSVLSTLEDPKNQPKNLEKKSKQLQNAKTKVREFANLRTSTYNRLEQVRSLIEREYYGRKVSDMEEANPRLTKWMGNLTKWSSGASLRLNIPSDLKNQFSGYVQTIIESTGGRFVTSRDLALSAAWATKAMFDWSSNGIYTTGPGNLSTQLVQIFDPNFKTTDQYGNTIYRSMFKDMMNFEWTFMHRKFGEMEVAMRLFGAFLYGQKVEQTLPNGTKATIRYVDAWEQDKNGIARLKAGIHPGWSNISVYHTYKKGETFAEIAKKYNVTVDELKAKNRIKSEIQIADGQEIIISKSENYKLFKNRLQGTSRALFGVYDDFGQPEGNKLLLYRMFFFMRQWFTPMFVNRFGMDTSKENFGGARYDWALGKTTKGFYINALQVIYRGIKSKGVEFQFMTDDEKADLKRATAEGMLTVITSLLASMLFGYDDDDEDRWKKIKARSGAINSDTFNTYGFLTNHALLLLLGVQAETSAFIPLPQIGGVNLGADDYAKMLTSTSTVFGNTILTYMEIIGDILNFATFNEAGRYKRDTGPYWFQKKGELKIWKRAFNLMGFSGGAGDPEALLKNLEKGASRIR